MHHARSDPTFLPLHYRIAFAELVGIVEVGEVAACEPSIGVDQRLDDLRVDLVADVALSLERDHVREARAFRNGDRRCEVSALTVLVADVLDEQHEKDVVLVLTGIHAVNDRLKFPRFDLLKFPTAGACSVLFSVVCVTRLPEW